MPTYYYQSEEDCLAGIGHENEFRKPSLWQMVKRVTLRLAVRFHICREIIDAGADDAFAAMAEEKTKWVGQDAIDLATRVEKSIEFAWPHAMLCQECGRKACGIVTLHGKVKTELHLCQKDMEAVCNKWAGAIKANIISLSIRPI